MAGLQLPGDPGGIPYGVPISTDITRTPIASRLNPRTGWNELVAGFAKRLAQGHVATAPAAPAPPPRDLNAEAAAMAAGIIDPQSAAIARTIAAKEKAIQGQGMAAKSVLQALAALSQGIPGQIQAAYERAGNDQAGYASGLTGAVGDAAQAGVAADNAQIAAQGAPGSVSNSDSQNAMMVANYLGGALPASSLAAEGASRFAEAATSVYSGEAALTQQALQDMNASRAEVEQLRQQGLDLENTRPAEVQKALLQLREDDRAERQLQADIEDKRATAAREEAALNLQKGTLTKQWDAQLEDTAWNRTNATGTLWTVKNGKLVNTGKPAPGSAAGRAIISANTQRARTATQARTAAQKRAADQAKNLTDQTGTIHVVQNGKVVDTGNPAPGSKAASNAEKRAKDRVAAANANAKLGISKANLAIAQQREARLAKGPKTKNNPGGYTSKQIQQWSNQAGSNARDSYNGILNPKFDNRHPDGWVDPNTGVKNRKYTAPPREAPVVLRELIAAGVPYSIAMKAILVYARRPNSRWAYALKWQKKKR
jgi:hypothetical protein